MNEEFQPLEDIANSKTTLSQALLFMKEHRYWSETTFDSYQFDVKLFEKYLVGQGLEPTLENGQHLSLVNKWIVQQKENDVAYKTTMRRVAALSSLYSFYKDLGIVQTNAFKASSVPGEHVEPHSRTLEMDDLKKVYRAIDDFEKEAIFIGVPIKLLLFTGFRNHAIIKLKVENINWEEGLIVYNQKIRNTKNKMQVLPLPPLFMEELKKHVIERELTNEDPLCYGIKGFPLKNKQLNALVNKVNDYLNWRGEERVTPHGFRYTIATLLDERGLSVETIKYLLGHSSGTNVDLYLRRHKLKIQQIKSELTNIESELEQSLVEDKYEDNSLDREVMFKKQLNKSDGVLPFSEEFILQLSKSNPQLLEKLMMEHYQ
ncbi:site-specific integrase [Peribacillus sp. Bi134]|uniref:tyrosine-type recombinase/integrase n=1 Tax=Peribacillus sp. Bi134 TaxID=2884272 RepID=UPI001D59D1AC|nr:site-specific integrase [Peribacillus sp. Bi134]CAH0168775.1 Tyrosine recombinase XerD [Peribacillus sp. Bi134]